ncbi:MAG: transcription elongation factor Spt5 [Thermoplasmata archaeon]
MENNNTSIDSGDNNFDISVYKYEDIGDKPVENKVIDKKNNRIEEVITSDKPVVYEFRIEGKSKGKLGLKISVKYETSYGNEGAEWNFYLLDAHTKKKIDPLIFNETIDFTGEYVLRIDVETPIGIRFGEKAIMELTAYLEDMPSVSKTATTITTARQSLMAIKCQRGYEHEVADSLYNKSRNFSGILFSIFVPSQLKGYVFVEGMSKETVRNMLSGINKARGIVEGTTDLEEIKNFLVPQSSVKDFVKGYVVELIKGPFKGEKGIIKSIDSIKEEVTVELLGAVVPIPVTVKGDSIRILEKEGQKDEKVN